MKQGSSTKEYSHEEFKNYMQKKNMSAHSISAYLASLRLYEHLYSDITPENLKNYRIFLLNHYCPATINQRIYGINQYLLFRAETRKNEDAGLDSFRLHPVKVQRKSFQNSIISNEDCSLLQDKLREEKHDFWYFIVRFLVTTGARVSELTQIKVEHLSCGFLDLYSKGGKIRRIYIPDSLCQEALAWAKKDGKTSGFLFLSKNGRPVTPRGIHSQLKHFAVRYGINPSTAYPHSFRHRFAKNFLLRCSDISLLADLLGHESVETTRIYLTRSSMEQKQLIDALVTW